QGNVQRFAPHVLRELEEDLLRREQRWRGGFEAETLASEMQTLLGREPFKQLPKPIPMPLPPRSLAVELAQLPGPAPALTPQNLREMAFILEQMAKPTEKKEELAKVKEQWLKLTSAKEIPPVLWAQELLAAAANLSQPRPAQLAFV